MGHELDVGQRSQQREDVRVLFLKFGMEHGPECYRLDPNVLHNTAKGMQVCGIFLHI